MAEYDEYNAPPPEPMAVFEEPPFDPEDTSPTGVVRQAGAAPITDKVVRRGGGPWLNWLLSGVAGLITLVAAVLYIQQNNRSAVPPTLPALATDIPATATLIPTVPPTAIPSLAPLQDSTDTTVPADVVAEMLRQPGDTAPPPDQIYRMQTAYTIAPVRSRAGVEEYKIEAGDTLQKIAQRFGLTEDTLVWNNDDIYVNRLLPGDTLTIPPENGIYYKTTGNETIQALADTYKVSPWAIIDSEYNRLQNASPTTLLPSGMMVMIPGGTSKQKARYWNPKIERRPAQKLFTGGSGASSNAAGEIAFASDQSGSCGFQPNGGGTGTLRVPLPVGVYTVIRGFFPGHTGIDLAAPIGTTVFAADGGTVIFAGWSNWGYGNSIVLAHGNMLTLYGHLSRITVRCGQQVGAGAPIGAVGSTGNSSGPHLHFEVRPGGGEPVNPVGYLGF